MEKAKIDIIHHVLEWEGGLVNDKDDSGGLTNFGITLPFLRDFMPEAEADDILNMTRGIAEEIYGEFYDRLRIDELPGCVKDVYFDMCVNHGVHRAGILLQRGISSTGYKIVIDGKVGAKTRLAAMRLARYCPEVFRHNVNEARKAFYDAIVARRVSQKKFYKGWINRLDSFRV